MVRSTAYSDIPDDLPRFADTVLLKTKQVLTLQKPSNKDYKNVRYWLLGRPQLDESELKYVLRKEDIITLRTGRESAAFDGAVERLVYHLDTFFRKRFKWNIIQVCTENISLPKDRVTHDRYRISS